MAKKIVSYILTFILVIIVIASTFLTILNQTILKKEFVINLLEKNEYYSKMYANINDTFINNTVQTGLDESILNGIITEEQVKKDVNSFVNYLYGREEISIDLDGVKTRLQENINKEIENNGKKLEQDEKEAINRYVAKIVEIYEDGITYARSYANTISNSIQKVQKIVNIAQISGYVATFIIVLILFAINKIKLIKYISVGLMSSGLLLIIPKIIEISTMEIYNILIFNKAFSEVLINGIETVISSFMITGIVAFVIGLVLSIIYAKMEKE